MKKVNPHPQVLMWTDGASKGNPGAGGWAAVLTYQNSATVVAGYEPYTTNNRMELMAVIHGLAALKRPCDVIVFSDSNYVVNTGKKIMRGGMPKSHVDAWLRLKALFKQHRVTFEKTEGHADDILNNVADWYAGCCAVRRVSVQERYEDLNQMMEKAGYGRGS